MRHAKLAIPLLAVSTLLAQPAFEVASVKPTTGRELGGVRTYPGGRVELRGCTLEYLIQQAFDIQAFQISHGPGWIASERYDIDGKPPASSRSIHSLPPYPKAPLNEEQRQMLQSLLVERFHLKYHRGTSEGAVYLLVKENKTLRMQDSQDKDAYPWSGSLGGGAISGDGLRGTNESMDDLAKRLSRYLDRPVLNRTELPGSFDFRIEYPSGDSRPDIVSMILTCVQGLGLKLEPSKSPIEIIVVEQVERPSAN